MDKYFSEVRLQIANAAIAIPAQRAAFKKGFSFSKLSFSEQLPIWHNIWMESAEYLPMFYAFLFLEQHITKPEHVLEIWKASVVWQQKVSDWSLCDSLAKLNTKALDQLPDLVYPQLEEWNKSANLWQRRQSVVSLLYFSRTKKTYPTQPQITKLLEPLLTDDEYYVQKGVGWAMRELHTVYPEAAHTFLVQHIRNVSPIAFTIAIEKMTSEEKEAIKLMRKQKATH